MATTESLSLYERPTNTHPLHAMEWMPSSDITEVKEEEHNYTTEDISPMKKNDIFFQMQGMRIGKNENESIRELDTDAQPYMTVNMLPEVHVNRQSQGGQGSQGRSSSSSWSHSAGDWDFTEEQKKDLTLNGRVSDIFERKTSEKKSPFVHEFKTSDKLSERPLNFQISQITGNMAASEVAELYFSKKNFQALQNGIRYMVYKKSNGRHIIGEQSNNELAVIMQTMYLRHGQDQIYNILEQVRSLNAKVLEYAVPEILKELDMYEKYLKDQSTLPVPLDRSPNVSSKGEKVLEFKGFF